MAQSANRRRGWELVSCWPCQCLEENAAAASRDWQFEKLKVPCLLIELIYKPHIFKHEAAYQKDRHDASTIFFSLAKVEVNNFCHFSILSSNLHQNNNSVTCPEWARPTTAIEAQAKETCCHSSSFFLRHVPITGKGVRRGKDTVQERRNGCCSIAGGLPYLSEGQVCWRERSIYKGFHLKVNRMVLGKLNE